jgi:hypothetical protein
MLPGVALDVQDDLKSKDLDLVLGRQVAGLTQLSAGVPRAIFIRRPHRRPLQIGPPPLNHKRFIGFNFSPD